MDGITTMKAAVAAALALMAMGGAIGPALAEDDAGVVAPAVRPATEAAADLPRFVPSADPEAAFDTAFAPFDDRAIVAPPAPSDTVVDDIPDGVEEPSVSWTVRQLAGLADHAGLAFTEVRSIRVAARTLWHWAYFVRES